MRRIDLNCDLGEGAGSDEQILPLVTSANVACGVHAGGPGVMRRTVDAAIQAGVAIGAHPGFQDLPNFGRVNIDLSPGDVFELVVYQIGALGGFVTAAGGRLAHVKAHGALYTMAAEDAALADAIARAVKAMDPALILFGLPKSELVRAGARAGIPTATEAFADRTYQRDGTLTPRGEAGALIADVQQAAAQAVRIVTEGKVRATDGTDIEIQADTICLHGDGAHALELAREIRRRMEDAGVTLAPVGRP
ncbi:MAG: LamB/YcsF family protein [Gemmatimonadetes bacterium]|nr:LamB/YcsF family protein [Gemmatimonadota bacterium]